MRAMTRTGHNRSRLAAAPNCESLTPHGHPRVSHGYEIGQGRGCPQRGTCCRLHAVLANVCSMRGLGVDTHGNAKRDSLYQADGLGGEKTMIEHGRFVSRSTRSWRYGVSFRSSIRVPAGSGPVAAVARLF